MTATKDTPFGVQLRQYRTALGLTQEELAEQARLSPRGIRALERGERTAPRRETVDLLADALQLDEGDRLSFIAAARATPLPQAPAPAVPRVPRNLRRWTVLVSWLLRVLSLAALFLGVIAVAYGGYRLIGARHAPDQVVGRPAPRWPAPPQLMPSLSDPVAIASDAGGEIYVLDARNNLIHAFASDGTPLFTFGGTGTGKGEFLGPSALAVDSRGTVYVVDTGNNRVQVFSSSGRWRASWTGQGEIGGPMQNPSGVSVGPGGRLYVADTGHSRLLVFSRAGRLVGPEVIPTEFAPTSVTSDGRGIIFVLSSGVIEALSPGGTMLNQWPRGDVDALAVDRRGGLWGVGGGPIAHFTARGYLLSQTHLPGTKGPEGISFDGRGIMYLADPRAGQVEEALPSGRIIARLGGSRPRPPRPPGIAAVATDRTGNVYVGAAGGRIEEYSPTGELLQIRILHDASPASAPRAIAVDSRGEMIAIDATASRVWELAPDGAVLHRWGKPGAGPGEFSIPSGVAVDSHGRVYIADAGNARIQVFSESGRLVRAIGLAPVARSIREPGIAPYPYGLAIDARDNLYVADGFLDTIFKLSPQGRLLGHMGSAGSAPGRLRSPQGVAVDRRGRVYVADTGNKRVQIFSPSGALLQVLGQVGRRGRLFDRPSGVAVDRLGNTYVTDPGQNRAQKFQPLKGGTVRQ